VGDPKDTMSAMQGLLCPDTLRVALRMARESSLPAREGLKELLSPAAEEPPPAKDHEFSRWERCLEVLVEEFLSRRQELLRLNKARKSQIESFVRAHAKSDLTLEEAVQGRLGSPGQEALQLFAHQACVFHLLQILLVKRWVDRGLLSSDCLKSNEHTLNWQITGFLKKNSPKGMMARHDWSFLKQNLFSWFSPSKDSWERLRLLLEPVNLANENADFPARLLRTLGSRSRLSLLGFNPTLVDSSSLWRLLLEQRAFDMRLESVTDLDFSSESSGPVLVSGLRNGESLNALRELSSKKELHGAWAFTDSEFERYLSELFILWECASEIPRINIHSRSLLRDLSRDATKFASLFADGLRMPYQAQFGACFQDRDGEELDDASFLLDQLRENGLLLVASDLFWPTDPGDGCERMREAVLRKASVRLIIDLRQLTAGSGESLPKGVFLLEKCSSKELRDSHRPQILRARGHLQKQQFSAVWEAILEHIRNESSPGDVSERNLSAAGDGVRIEAMAAAASQQELRSSPWITLSDPAFYEASYRLRRSPSKAYNFGMVMRWRPGMPPPPQRAVILQEQPKSLVASLPGENLPLDAAQYFFLPEASVAEQPLFYVAQAHSAPVQFWYRLELEQNAGKRPKQVERQSEQRLKMMPFLRLFEAGTLLPVQPPPKPIESLDEVRQRLTGIFRQPGLGMAERSSLHEIILSLESAVAQNLGVCGEFSRHLFPEMTVKRWSIPSTLPPLAPVLALDIFRHLDRSPVLQHPSIHITKLRTVHDFKVTNCSFEEMQLGALGELKVFHGMDPALKLSGPTLMLKAAQEEILRRLGRPWRETAEKILFPTDFMLVQTQLKHIVQSIERELQLTREHLALLDQIFCCLFGLSRSFSDDSVRIAMRRHLNPEDSRVQLRLQKQAEFRPAAPGAPTEILQ
jgi:hypothetical protein